MFKGSNDRDHTIIIIITQKPTGYEVTGELFSPADLLAGPVCVITGSYLPINGSPFPANGRVRANCKRGNSNFEVTGDRLRSDLFEVRVQMHDSLGQESAFEVRLQSGKATAAPKAAPTPPKVESAPPPVINSSTRVTPDQFVGFWVAPYQGGKVTIMLTPGGNGTITAAGTNDTSEDGKYNECKIAGAKLQCKWTSTYRDSEKQITRGGDITFEVDGDTLKVTTTVDPSSITRKPPNAASAATEGSTTVLKRAPK